MLQKKIWHVSVTKQANNFCAGGTFGFPEETFLSLSNKQNAFLLKLVRRLFGQGCQLSLVEPHLGRVLDSLKQTVQ